MSKIMIKFNKNTKKFKSSHVVIMDGDKVLIVQRSLTDAWMPGHFGLPGGKSDNDETNQEALVRECMEEVNLHVSPDDLVFLSKISNKANHGFYYTTKFSGNISLNNEHSDFKWVNPKDLSKFKVVPDLIEIVSAVLEHMA
jgi:8-oxo-dGTP diphosphatase